MHLFNRFGHLVGGTLLVAGTSIGVGMLALPVSTGGGGFFPAVFIYFLCWIFMLCTGLLILEACAWCPKDANLITLANSLLGKGGKVGCWILYLFLFTCLMVAHVASGGNVVNDLSGRVIPNWVGVLIYVGVFSPVVYLGAKWVDRLNVVLMTGVLLSYFFFIYYALPHVSPSLLTHAKWTKAWHALPVIFTAFGYQSLIPTLYNYMGRNTGKVRRAIIYGTCIPLAIYLVWEMIILGIIPAAALNDALAKGQDAVHPLSDFLKNTSITNIGHTFAFFAMTTSFVGISIAFVDFLADGLKIEKKGMKKLGLCGLIFGIPMIIVLTYPHVFIFALTYAGGIGVALLLGAMPILMVWAGRYYEGHSLMNQQLRGGKITLGILLAFVVFELVFQFL